MCNGLRKNRDIHAVSLLGSYRDANNEGDPCQHSDDLESREDEEDELEEEALKPHDGTDQLVNNVN